MIIKNAKLVNYDTLQDIRIEDGFIIDIENELHGEVIYDAKGKYVLPTIFDLDVRIKDNTINVKNLNTLSKEALRGGVRRLMLNPKTTPSISTEITQDFVFQTLKNTKIVNVRTIIDSVGEDGKLSNIAIMLKQGANAIYIDSDIDTNTALNVAKYASMYDVPLFVKAEDKSISGDGSIVEGEMASSLGLKGIDPLSESLEVGKFIEIAREYGIKVLFLSLASVRSFELIKKAKDEGVKVYAQMSLHHLLFCDQKCKGFNTKAKISPPFATSKDFEKLLNFFKDNQVDVLTLQNQPFVTTSKDVAFYDAAFGIESITYAYSLYYTKLVKSEICTLDKLLELISYNNSKIISNRKNNIEIGKKVDFIIFDQDSKVVVKNQNSIYADDELYGKIETLFYRDTRIEL